MADARDVTRNGPFLTCSECYQKSTFVIVLRITQDASPLLSLYRVCGLMDLF